MPRAARRPTSSPRTCSRCTPGTRRPRGGRSRSSPPAPPSVTGSTRWSSWSRARTPGSASSTRAGPTGCSGCRSPSHRVGSTPPRRSWPCCPRRRRSTSTSTRATSRSTSTGRPAPGGSRSTRPTRRFGSPISRPGSWWPCRTRRARSRTAPRRWWSCARDCSRRNRTARRQSCREQRRSQVGGGGRSEKIRTYNFKDNRVTDHRIKLTLHKLDRILLGDLDELTDALVADKRAHQLDEG